MDIEQLQKLLNFSSNIKWSKHCLERMQERYQYCGCEVMSANGRNHRRLSG